MRVRVRVRVSVRVGTWVSVMPRASMSELDISDTVPRAGALRMGLKSHHRRSRQERAANGI